LNDFGMFERSVDFCNRKVVPPGRNRRARLGAALENQLGRSLATRKPRGTVKLNGGLPYTSGKAISR
jgi:hypothetical protein